MSVSSPANIPVTSHHLNIGDTLRQRSRDTILSLAQRHGANVQGGRVSFDKDGSGSTTCKIMVRVGAGRMVQAQSRQRDPKRALDGAAGHLASQLGRVQDRLVNSHAKRDDKTAYLEAGLIGDMIPPPPAMPLHMTL